jgi:prepilin-type N-terminal cleavage/methylation domain-containing protein
VSRGFTLAELLAALTVLGLGAGVAALALPTLRPTPEGAVLRSLAAARDSAIRTGIPVVWQRDSVRVRFLPDGVSSGGRIALARDTLLVDPLNGAVHVAH